MLQLAQDVLEHSSDALGRLSRDGPYRTFVPGVSDVRSQPQMILHFGIDRSVVRTHLWGLNGGS